MLDSKKIAMQALCTGCVAAVAAKMLVGDLGNFDILGINVPQYVGAGIGAAAGSVASDLASGIVIKNLGLSNQAKNASTFAVEGAVGGIATAAFLWFTVGIEAADIPLTVMVGAGSKYAGNAINEKLFDPRSGFLTF